MTGCLSSVSAFRSSLNWCRFRQMLSGSYPTRKRPATASTFRRREFISSKGNCDQDKKFAVACALCVVVGVLAAPGLVPTGTLTLSPNPASGIGLLHTAAGRSGTMTFCQLDDSVSEVAEMVFRRFRLRRPKTLVCRILPPWSVWTTDLLPRVKLRRRGRALSYTRWRSTKVFNPF